jgi:DNA primase
MSAFFSNELIDKVRSRVDIVEVISATVSLKQVGKNLSGLCPFHSEKVPSFVVNREKQFFHCYGCHAGGDVFKFLMLRDNISFFQAVKMIAEEKNIPLPMQRKSKTQEKLQQKREALYQLNKAAVKYFRENLLNSAEGSRGKQYLSQRGINPEIQEKFQLGYSRNSWEDLYSKFTASGVNESLLLEAGLIAKRSREEGYYDFFRERLMFPIFDKEGHPVGFGGRLLGEGDPKYLNSPDTAVFHKSWSLFGLNHAYNPIRKKGFSVLVEGYFDLISLHQNGIDNVVAPLGTSFTKGHSKILSRLAKKVIICFDPDDAGKEATKRALNTFLEEDFQVKAALLPEGYDPDSYIKEFGKKEMSEKLKNAKPAIEYLLMEAVKEKDISNPYQKLEALNAVLPWIAKVKNNIERLSYIGLVAGELNIKDDLVLEQLRQRLRKGSIEPIPYNVFLAPMGIHAELRVLQKMLQEPDCLHQLLPQLEADYFSQPQYQSIFNLIKKAYLDRRNIAYYEMVNLVEDEEVKNLLARIASDDMEPIENIDVSLYINALKRSFLEKQQRKLQYEIEEAQKMNDRQRSDRLSMQKIKIKKEIETLS